MEKKTNSYVEAVKRATAKQLEWDKLKVESDHVNNWISHMINSSAKAQGRHLREI